MTEVPPVARTEFNWPDEFRNLVTSYPVDAHCQGAEPAGCDNTVVWVANFHGCWQELLCQRHLGRWAELLQARVLAFGAVHCDECGRDFADVNAVATVRAV